MTVLTTADHQREYPTVAEVAAELACVRSRPCADASVPASFPPVGMRYTDADLQARYERLVILRIEHLDSRRHVALRPLRVDLPHDLDVLLRYRRPSIPRGGGR